MPRELTIDGRRIADDTDVFVIAEIGHNHQGSVETCMEMFRAARDCGADAVKLQKRCNRRLFTREMYDSPYENENSYGATYGEHRDALEFDIAQYRDLQAFARELGIVFFATAFDDVSADELAGIDVPAYKIASADLRNLPLLRHVARAGKPVVISTGGALLDDVRQAHDAICETGTPVCVLQCTAAYPCDPDIMNLRVIESFRRAFPESVVGLSDHQNGIAMPLVAYALGARVVEKHFTMNRAWKGTDHAFSLEPVGLTKMVRDLRRARSAMGDGVKRPLDIESRPLRKMSKKIVAVRDLAPGHVVSATDLEFRSPGDGLPPCEIEVLLGKTVIRPVRQEQALARDDVKA